MAWKEPKTVTIENAQLIFKNFAGDEDKFNAKGDRNFGVLLPFDVGEAMQADGWNVKWLDPREEDEGEESRPWLPVKVSFKNRPPLIVMITSVSRTHVNEDMVGSLDVADMKLVDLIVTAYEWEVNEKRGIKAYLKTMYVTLNEDELTLKYGGVSGIGVPTDAVSEQYAYDGKDTHSYE